MFKMPKYKQDFLKFSALTTEEELIARAKNAVERIVSMY
jgi:hypothetical protein